MLHNFLKNRYGLNNYQIAQLRYVFFTVFSEISKFGIILFLFRERFLLCITTLLLLCVIRSTAGGFHCNTYAGCLLFSIGYVFLCLRLLPMIETLKTVRLLLSALCVFINYLLAPLSSSKHLPLAAPAVHKYKLLSTAILIFYFMIMLITPETSYTISGFWVMILHAVQLLAAAVQKNLCAAAHNPKAVQERSPL